MARLIKIRKYHYYYYYGIGFRDNFLAHKIRFLLCISTYISPVLFACMLQATERCPVDLLWIRDGNGVAGELCTHTAKFQNGRRKVGHKYIPFFFKS